MSDSIETKNMGRIVQIIGPVLDIVFAKGQVPNIYNALTIRAKNTAGIEMAVTCEVQQLLGDNSVRAVSMNPTEGLMRGMEVIDTGKPLSVPVGKVTLGRIFNVLGEPVDNMGTVQVSETLPIHRKASEIWINKKHPFNTSLGIIPKIPRKEKIKIGYYCADFRDHPVSYLTVEFFELHDKNQFELIAFYSGAPDSSYIQKRISSTFNEFIDIRLKSDKEVAELSRAMGIVIAIDLTGLTANERVGIFSYRAAPIQLSYIGYLGTLGVEYYDYLIADKTIIPVESQIYYVEKIIYLPCYQVNDSKRLIADKIFKKTELNLPLNGFIFCCFNNNYKIVPSTFDGWMKILSAVPDSVLFLYAANKWAEANLRMEAERRGVRQNRLVFASRIERVEYLARYKIPDLFLDTLPYNAGTTASDALWAGLPVLTCMGESFASRVAASLLNAIELPELITTTQAEFEARAIELATNPDKLRMIKEKLNCNRLTTALFNTPSFTKSIESAYKKIYENYHDDLPINHIYIES